MAKYIDADKLADMLNAKGDMAVGTPAKVFYHVANMLKNLPPADVVAVVRCKDCKYYADKQCKKIHFIARDLHIKQDNDFCSYGERKEDE